MRCFQAKKDFYLWPVLMKYLQLEIMENNHRRRRNTRDVPGMLDVLGTLEGRPKDIRNVGGPPDCISLGTQTSE